MVIVVIYKWRCDMAYFLKKSTLKNRTYLAIVESFYNHGKKGTAHKTYKSLGSIETLKENGMDDPVAFYQAEVDRLNEERKDKEVKKITNISPMKHIGYFPLKTIMTKLNIQNFLDLYKYATDFEFDLFSLLSSLVYARSVNPCSKNRTFHEVMPSLYEGVDFSYDQLLNGLSFFGTEYQKIIELFTHQTSDKFGISTDTTYFDCTNFYFEIDKEDDLRKKGPSKENRKMPIVSMGLLLDSNQIPIGMKIFPGNESEKPILREVIDGLKKQNHITGKTIHVADKGINCTENIVHSLKNHDGYLFSKSVKMLSKIEKEWVLIEDGWRSAKDNQGEIIYQYKSCIDEFPYAIVDKNGKKVTVNLKEKRLLTYNPSLAKKKQHEIKRLIEKAEKLRLSHAKKAEYGEAGKYMSFDSVDKEGKKTGKKVVASINKELIDKDMLFAGFNLLVTSETKMSDQDMYSTYHNLWRIEESFKIMKSDLDARPIFLQKEETIKGHFLICYITVLLERLFQFKVLNDEYSTNEIFDFIKKFKVVESENQYINVTTTSTFIRELDKRLSLPLTNYYLTPSQIKKVLNWKLS